MTVHRFIPATKKHSAKTACGIHLFFYGNDVTCLDVFNIEMQVSHRGQPFDCKRCRSQLELRHQRDERMTA